MGDAATVLTTARWSEDTYYLKEFIHKFTLPQVVKVVKGQYLNVGVSTISSPALCSTLLLGHTPRRPAILAQCVKFKEGKRVVPIGCKLSIPESYEGYFDILSEDGRSVRCIESVSELARRFPESVLVRENLKAFVSKSDDIETLHEKSRTILTGEILILVGEVLGVKGKNQTRYLRCFDAEGENVYLPYDLKGGRFSALAKEENISGVHTIANLAKKRLPLMVRLAHGAPPLYGAKAGQQQQQLFVPELRLLSRSDEDTLMAVPLCKENQTLYLPQGANLKLQPLVNFEYVSGMAEVSRLLEKGEMQLAALRDRILCYESVGREADRKPGQNRKSAALVQEARRNAPATTATPTPTIYGLLAAAANRSDLSGGRHGGSGGGSDDYDEIDQIYDYVRGFAPLPKTAKGWHYISDGDEDHHSQQRRRSSANAAILALDVNSAKEGKGGGGHYGRLYSSAFVKSENSENRPPEPPPIETIPSRRGINIALVGGNSSPMDVTPPVTPPFSPPWGNSPLHSSTQNLSSPTVTTPLGPSGQRPNSAATAIASTASPSHLIYERPQSADQPRLFEKSPSADLQLLLLSKKRQRPKTAHEVTALGDMGTKKAESEDLGKMATTPASAFAAAASISSSRYIKAANRQSSGGGGGNGGSTKHRFFKSRSSKENKSNNNTANGHGMLHMMMLPHSTNSGNNKSPASQQQQPSFFNLRYKSLTNLTQQQQEYDTLDSSNSGGKTSFDSAGSRSNVPEKRSRRQRLSRPKSLTNLVWEFRAGGGGGPEKEEPSPPPPLGPPLHRSNSKPSLLMAERGRLEHILYGSRGPRNLSPGTRKLASKNLGAALYL